jgi:hypothetical protein
MTPRAKVLARSEYLIDRYHVTCETGATWHCACAEFTASNDCRHTRESQGRLAAQVNIANRLTRPRDLSGSIK